MKANNPQNLFPFIEENRISIQDVADQLGKKVQTIYNWKTKGVPPSQHLSVQAWMDKKTNGSNGISNLIVMEPSPRQFKKWNECALVQGKLIEDWAFDGLNRLADIELTPDVASVEPPHRDVIDTTAMEA